MTLIATPAILCLPRMARPQQPFTPAIPRTWDDEAIKSLELPLATKTASPKHITADYYYRIPVRPIYRSYPIYHPDHEPPGYWDSLKQKNPEVIFDATKLTTEDDWINAGEAVFDAPVEYESNGTLFTQLRGRDWYEKNKVPLTRDGVFPFMRYVIREKGKVEVGTLACAMCHSRVMSDGSVIKGAQGNFPDDRSAGYEVKLEAAGAPDSNIVLTELRRYLRRNYATPWLPVNPNARTEQMSLEQLTDAMMSITPGSCARQGSSIFFPTRIPDLIGVKDRFFLDSTGLFQQRNIGDLMRYVALNQGADMLSEYGDFRPRGELPEPTKESRYSDEQLYALALFVYSLKPPPNPNHFDDVAARGQIVFQRERCGACHTPPLYTNNMLTPVDGFKVPPEQQKIYNILPFSLGTDPTLALETRRGTGYYKVPSLKGVWYRGPFQHNGSVLTLEDWFDPRRLKEGYIPTGFRGYGVSSRPVKGHSFGLDLSPEDRTALIAFLKTL
ncbi:MAG TPA: hypothetical protein VKB46_07450 [Pyrinomonadaceae bacterium]|nr:hypothetical protein [Pyrinomonadaceae bacterium]